MTGDVTSNPGGGREWRERGVHTLARLVTCLGHVRWAVVAVELLLGQAAATAPTVWRNVCVCVCVVRPRVAAHRPLPRSA